MTLQIHKYIISPFLNNWDTSIHWRIQGVSPHTTSPSCQSRSILRGSCLPFKSGSIDLVKVLEEVLNPSLGAYMGSRTFHPLQKGIWGGRGPYFLC